MERRQGTLELLVAAPTPFPLLIVPLTLSMATIGAYSMVATLLWGRFVFGIHDRRRRPASCSSLAVLVTVIAIGMLGFLLAIASVRYRTAWALGSALEMPVWLICGFLVPLSLAAGLGRARSPGCSPPTWGMAAIRTAAERRQPVADSRMCLLAWPRPTGSSARSWPGGWSTPPAPTRLWR